MYSYEDRIRAVELYIKLGKRTSPTIRQLGYPTKNALKGWYREYQRLLDLPLGYHRARAAIGDKYVGVRQSITEIFESNHRCYGYRRLQASLAREQGPISEKVIQRLMKQESLVVAKPKRRRYASYLGEISPAPENIINRDFQAAAPNKKWLTDITEFQIPAGKVYLSPIIDCFDGMVVSWTIGTSPDAELVNTMLDAAIETVTKTSDRPVHGREGSPGDVQGRFHELGVVERTCEQSRRVLPHAQQRHPCTGWLTRRER